MMRIVQETHAILDRYAHIPHTFLIDSMYHVIPPASGNLGFEFIEKPVKHPYRYDFDAHDHVSSWLSHGWDLSNWGFYVAYEADVMVGGAIVAYDTPGVYMLQGRSDITCLWDIRVHPDAQRKGIGKALFEQVKAFSHARNCVAIKIETQNTNVRANAFYRAQGCVLGGLNRFAYPDDLNEVQLLWWYIL